MAAGTSESVTIALVGSPGLIIPLSTSTNGVIQIKIAPIVFAI
jgi:hypothetical protein